MPAVVLSAELEVTEENGKFSTGNAQDDAHEEADPEDVVAVGAVDNGEVCCAGKDVNTGISPGKSTEAGDDDGSNSDVSDSESPGDDATDADEPPFRRGRNGSSSDPYSADDDATNMVSLGRCPGTPGCLGHLGHQGTWF